MLHLMGANPFTNIVNSYGDENNVSEINSNNTFNVLQFNRERSALGKLKKNDYSSFGEYDEDSFLSEPYKQSRKISKTPFKVLDAPAL